MSMNKGCDLMKRCICLVKWPSGLTNEQAAAGRSLRPVKTLPDRFASQQHGSGKPTIGVIV